MREVTGGVPPFNESLPGIGAEGTPATGGCARGGGGGGIPAVTGKGVVDGV